MSITTRTCPTHKVDHPAGKWCPKCLEISNRTDPTPPQAVKVAESAATQPTPEGITVDAQPLLREIALAAARMERDELARFKAYVHERLDQAGVPVDPPSEHREKGCRIGGRLDWLLSHIFATVEAATAPEGIDVLRQRWAQMHALITSVVNGMMDDPRLTAKGTDIYEPVGGERALIELADQFGKALAAIDDPFHRLRAAEGQAMIDRAYAERDAVLLPPMRGVGDDEGHRRHEFLWRWLLHKLGMDPTCREFGGIVGHLDNVLTEAKAWRDAQSAALRPSPPEEMEGPAG